MVRVPDAPRIQRIAPGASVFTAGGVAPLQDATGKQATQLGDATVNFGSQIRRNALLKSQQEERARLAAETQAEKARLAAETQAEKARLAAEAQAEKARLAEKEKIDRTRAREADAFAKDGDRSAKLDYLNLFGSSADAAWSDYQNGFIERTKAAFDSLDNEDQRFAFNERRMGPIRESFLNIGATHRAKQIEVADIEANTRSVEDGVNDMVSDYDLAEEEQRWQDPPPKIPYRPRATSHDERLAELIVESRTLAPKIGEDPTAFALEQTTKAHTGILDQLMVDGNLNHAKRYLDENRPQIQPQEATALQKKLQGEEEKRKRISGEEDVETQAFLLEAELREQGADFETMVAALRFRVREGGLSPAVALKTQQIASSNNDRIKSSKRAVNNDILSAFEERAYRDESLTIETLPPSEADGYMQRGLMPEIRDRLRDVKSNQFADLIVVDPGKVIAAREFDNVGEMRRALVVFEQIKGSLDVTKKEDQEREKIMDKRIKEIQDAMLEASRRGASGYIVTDEADAPGPFYQSVVPTKPLPSDVAPAKLKKVDVDAVEKARDKALKEASKELGEALKGLFK